MEFWWRTFFTAPNIAARTQAHIPPGKQEEAKVLFRPCQGELRATGRNECPGGREHTLISDKVRGRDFPFQLDEGSLLFAFSTKIVPLADNLFISRQMHVSFNKALCGTLAFAVTVLFFWFDDTAINVTSHCSQKFQDPQPWQGWWGNFWKMLSSTQYRLLYGGPEAAK